VKSVLSFYRLGWVIIHLYSRIGDYSWIIY